MYKICGEIVGNRVSINIVNIHMTQKQCTLMLRFVENCRSDLFVLLFKESIPSVCTLNNLMFVCNIYMNQG